MKSYLPFLLSVVLFASCGDSSSSESAYVPLKQVIGTQTATSTSGTTAPSFVTDTSVHLTPGTKQVSTTPANTQALNPPHGQPGHRCDIPDGAPLPNQSAPVTQQLQQPVVTQIQPNTVKTPTVVTNTVAKTPKGMNPPHGEPGHKCEIAVGAPLDSKPTTPQPQQTVTTTPTKTAPGMNPPHGEAGHRCDIAVGSPLPKTEAKTDAKTNENAIVPVKNEAKDSTKG